MPVKIIIIHGLNNNLEGFLPLAQSLNSLGYATDILCLPGHGDNRQEAKSDAEAMRCFDQRMQELIKEPYSVIAFSQGALYLQLWLDKNPSSLPQSQILLAPALFIRHFEFLNGLMSTLPKFFYLLSQTPKKLRRYNQLYVWEYRNLFRKAKQYQEIDKSMKVTTLILIDPKDEVVDAKKLKQELDNGKSGARIEYFERKYLRGKRPGKYHILFNPEYFNPSDWKSFISRIDEFLKETSSGA
jgi:alpha-beta hydrolase superfamily lysophospholipase